MRSSLSQLDNNNNNRIMDPTDLKCNNLNCRKILSEKAVVTTCSHVFCVECANALFDASQACPACRTVLSEPDDVVITSLRPTNDYKTSVLSGLSPTIILEICNRAIAFWQYQVQQEGSYQQAVLKNMNDKNLHLTKQLDNVVREAHGEMNFLKSKITGLERELDDEKRKNREMQASLREKDKEYQKLKAQSDNLKRKTLLVQAPMIGVDSTIPGSVVVGESSINVAGMPTLATSSVADHHQHSYSGQIQTGNLNRSVYNVPGSDSSINRMADSMETFKIQRTPLKQNRGSANFGEFKRPAGPAPQQQRSSIYDRTNVSDTSDNEVQNNSTFLGIHQGARGIQALGQRGKHAGIKMRNEVRSNGSLHY